MVGRGHPGLFMHLANMLLYTPAASASQFLLIFLSFLSVLDLGSTLVTGLHSSSQFRDTSSHVYVVSVHVMSRWHTYTPPTSVQSQAPITSADNTTRGAGHLPSGSVTKIGLLRTKPERFGPAGSSSGSRLIHRPICAFRYL
ncbi:MAG: hypothetical protein A3K18_11810 [Lentisphaerae bacterium RIFOXYA12_64_32]|nr:MAG: hypothetical protein A3K18_11810 [Lentisphaerae bacterium RIFOXYA12_64_32]